MSYCVSGSLQCSAERVWPRNEAVIKYPSEYAFAILESLAAIDDAAERRAALATAKRKLHMLMQGRAQGPSIIFRSPPRVPS